MKKFLSCLGFLLLGFCFLVLVGLIAVSLSGVKEIPFLSPLLYKKPPALPRSTTASLDLEAKLVDALSSKQKLKLTEGEVSVFLKDATKDRLQDIKVNIFTDKVLVLAVLEAKPPVYFTFSLKPQDDESSNLEIEKVKVGYLPLPLFLVKSFLPGKGVISFKEVFAEQGLQLRSLELKDRELVLDLDWDKMLQDFSFE